MLFFALSLSLSLSLSMHSFTSALSLSLLLCLFENKKNVFWLWVVGGVGGGVAAASCVLGEQKRKEKEGREKKS